MKVLRHFIKAIAIGTVCVSCNSSGHLDYVKVNLSDESRSCNLSSFLKKYEIIGLEASEPEAVMTYPDRLLFSEDRIFVMDRGGNKIIMFDRDGNFLKSTAKMNGRGHHEYIRIIDATMDEKEKRLYVHCDAPYQMMVFDFDLNLEKVIPMDYYMGEIAIEGKYLYGICYDEPKDGGGYKLVAVEKTHIKEKPRTLLSHDDVIMGRWTLGKSLMPCKDGVYVCLPFDTRICKFKNATLVEEYNMDFGDNGLVEHPVESDMPPAWFDKNYRDINWAIVNMTESDSLLLFNTNKTFAFIMNKKNKQCDGYGFLDNDFFPIFCSRIIPSQGWHNGVVYTVSSRTVESALKQIREGDGTQSPTMEYIKQKFDPDGNPLVIIWDIR